MAALDDRDLNFSLWLSWKFFSGRFSRSKKFHCYYPPKVYVLSNGISNFLLLDPYPVNKPSQSLLLLPNCFILQSWSSFHFKSSQEPQLSVIALYFSVKHLEKEKFPYIFFKFPKLIPIILTEIHIDFEAVCTTTEEDWLNTSRVFQISHEMEKKT